MINNVTFVKPDYYDDFQCIGGACRHNCCSYGWKIPIDKKTFKTYKNYRGNSKLEQLFTTNIKKTEFEEYYTFGHIVHVGEESKCPFEDDDHLCLIHKELGANSLSVTCKTFPRSLTAYSPKGWRDDRSIYYNQSFSIGCEVVVKQLLEHVEPIELLTTTKQMTNNAIYRAGTETTSPLNAEARPLFENYYYIISIVIAILQNRALCFEDRLILLGLYCQKLNDIELSHTEDSVVEQSEAFITSIDDKDFADTFKDVHMDYLKQTKFLVLSSFFPNSFNQKLFFDNNFSRMHDNFTKTAIGNTSIDIDYADYCNFKNNYNEFMANKQHFLENLFVNIVLYKNLPLNPTLNPTLSPFEGFQQIVALYLTMRFYIQSYLGNEKTMPDQELIDLIAMWGRVDGNKNQHTKNSIENIINDGFEGAASLAQMVMYIK